MTLRVWLHSHQSLRVDPKQITLYSYISLFHFFQKVINYIAQSSKMTPKGRLSTPRYAFEPCWDGQNGGKLRRTIVPYKNQCAFKISVAKGKFYLSSYTFLYKFTHEEGYNISEPVFYLYNRSKVVKLLPRCYVPYG